MHALQFKRVSTVMSSKKSMKETLTSHRLYTTNFIEMNKLFSRSNKYLPVKELDAMTKELQKDYNKKHFIRDHGYTVAANCIEGELRDVFVEELKRLTVAEYSGFLLYTAFRNEFDVINPQAALLFQNIARDEIRHAIFANNILKDFGENIDLVDLPYERKHVFFPPKFILYATYLSESIAYWRYITIYRHLETSPENKFHPLFDKFHNWCQDENRHADILGLALKTNPYFLNGFWAKVWSKFFATAVYTTMYVNDHVDNRFYDALGIDVDELDRHVIQSTNDTVRKVLPIDLDVYSPLFWKQLENISELNNKIRDIDDVNAVEIAKMYEKIPIYAKIAFEFVTLLMMPERRHDHKWYDSFGDILFFRLFDD